jgi:hypothetical protein
VSVLECDRSHDEGQAASERGATRVVFETTVSDAFELSPSVDGGAHVIDTHGTLACDNHRVLQ